MFASTRGNAWASAAPELPAVERPAFVSTAWQRVGGSGPGVAIGGAPVFASTRGNAWASAALELPPVERPVFVSTRDNAWAEAATGGAPGVRLGVWQRVGVRGPGVARRSTRVAVGERSFGAAVGVEGVRIESVELDPLDAT
ncbi:MAG: hypothetical protein ACOZQL_11955 [Myxococcota bacterium]